MLHKLQGLMCGQTRPWQFSEQRSLFLYCACSETQHWRKSRHLLQARML